MANGIETKVEGLQELERKFRQLAPNLGRNALRAGVNAACEPIRKEAIVLAAFKTGAMRRNIYKKQIRELSGLFVQTFFISVRQKRDKNGKGLPWYWKLIEFGTKYAPARPFMRPAYESKKNASIERFKEKFKERLDVEARKK